MATIFMGGIHLERRKDLYNILTPFSKRNHRVIHKFNLGIGRGRGLIEGDEEACQTFEIVIPRLLRLEFNKIYLERLRAIYSNHQ
jgi:hypothetical protein